MPSTPSDRAAARRPDPTLGVFETLLARDGRIQALTAHLDRLAASVSELYGALLPNGLADRLHELSARERGERRLRVDVAPLRDGVDTELSGSPLPSHRHRPQACRPLRVAGGLGGHKWSDRRLLDSASAGTTPVIVDGDELLEAAWGNLWLIEGRRLITPPADGRLLPGVTRAMLLELAPSLGLEAREETVALNRARAADAIFLTSSLRHAVVAELAPGGAGGEASVSRIVGAPVSRIADALSRVRWE